MSVKKLIVKSFEGGLAVIGEKKDIPNSFRWLKGLNPYEDPSYITQSRKATKVSGAIVDGLIYWAEDGSPWSTNRYFYGSGGKIYQETSGGTWSSLRTVTNGEGEGFKVFDDYLYYALEAELGRYGKLSGTPAFSDSFLSDGTTDKDQSGGSTGSADYVPPTTIAETATARQTFTPTRDSLKAVIIDVDVVGTGDWTVTVHDTNNTLIGSKAIANGSMSTGDVTFTFATPLRVVIDNAYHFHVTSTVADGGVDTGTDTDLENAEFTTLFGILISATFHPIVSHLNQIVIGNERYLAVWDQAVYNPNKITFPAGFEVRSLAKFEEFVVAGCYKGATISEAEASRLYFWDGISSTFNFYTDVTIGAPNALHNSKNRLLGVYGNKGAIYLNHSPFEDVIDEVPKLTRGKIVEVYPGAITEFEGKTLIGIGSTDDAVMEQGVYEYGRQANELPESFNFPFIISTGTTQATTVKIGTVKAFGKSVYIGWRDDTSYGVDKITAGDGASATATLESLIFDGGNPDKEFLALNLTITFETLTTGQSVTPKYKCDRGSFTNGTAGTVGDTRIETSIYSRCKEFEMGFTLASTSNTFIKITSIELEYDDLAQEGTSG